jgi:hypothetical protein
MGKESSKVNAAHAALSVNCSAQVQARSKSLQLVAGSLDCLPCRQGISRIHEAKILFN